MVVQVVVVIEESTGSSPETDLIATLLAGATARILVGLGAVGDAVTVLDLACGTGEPTASIVREHPSWNVIGVDHDPDALAVARDRVPSSRAEFRLGSMTDLDLPEAGVDVVVSRMGALMMGDTRATASEIARVLRPGGRASILTWAEMVHNPFLATVVDTMRAVGAPRTRIPDYADLFDPMAAVGVREGWLRSAGMRSVESERFTWSVSVPDFEAWWRFQVGGVSGHHVAFSGMLAELDQAGRDRVRAVMAQRMAEYGDARGGYAVPATAQLVHGTR